MSESKSPVICVTCKRPFPPGITSEDSPRYFAQSPLLPKSDDPHDFATEAQTIVGYVKAVANVVAYTNKEISFRDYDTLMNLIGDLSDEAERRLQLSLDAMYEIEHRHEGHGTSTQEERGA